MTSIAGYKHFQEVEDAMYQVKLDDIQKLTSVLQVVKKSDGVVYTFGNGGSHATALHFTNDLMKIVKLRSVCVGEISAAMLAFGNDEGWDDMFAAPLMRMLKPGDGVVAFTCSGNSRNVIEGLKVAEAHGHLAAGLTGNSIESEINGLNLDALVHVPAKDIRVQEDVHLMICHAVVRMMSGG